MMKSTKDEKGFSAIETVIIVVIIIVIGGVGWYVLKARKSTTTSHNTAATTSATSTKTVTNLTPEQVLSQLTSAMKAKNKANFEALISSELEATVKASGAASTYDSLTSDQASAAIFTQVDYTKYEPVVADYTSKAGVTGGKQLTYTVVTTTGGAKSTNVYKFSFVPKGNSWLLDDMSLDFNDSANVSTP